MLCLKTYVYLINFKFGIKIKALEENDGSNERRKESEGNAANELFV